MNICMVDKLKTLITNQRSKYYDAVMHQVQMQNPDRDNKLKEQAVELYLLNVAKASVETDEEREMLEKLVRHGEPNGSEMSFDKYRIYRYSNGVESSIAAEDVRVTNDKKSAVVNYHTRTTKKAKEITIPLDTGRVNNTIYDTDNVKDALDWAEKREIEQVEREISERNFGKKNQEVGDSGTPASIDNARLQDGDKIKLYSQVKVPDGHITLNFNPEGENNTGPSIPDGFREGDKVKVVTYGEFKNADMEYDVVYIENKNGDKVFKQPSGTPYHVTKYVNKDNGIKPFMTGEHAKTQEWDIGNVINEYEGEIGYEYGTYNKKYDKSITLGATKQDINEKAKEQKNYEKQKKVLVNDFDAVRLMMRTLNKDSDVKASEEYINDLEKVLNVFVGHDKDYIPKNLNIYLNKKGDSSVGGFVPYSAKGQAQAGIYITKGKEVRSARNQQGPAEKFVHELLHGALFYAMESGNPDIAQYIGRLNKIHRDVIKTLKWEDLAPKDPSKKEQELAEAMLEYIQEGKYSMHEFVVLALTNESLMNKLKTVTVKEARQKEAKNMFEAIINYVKEIFNAMNDIATKGRPGESVYEAIMGISVEIAKANNNATVAHKKQGVSKIIADSFEGVNSKIKDVIEGIEKQGVKIYAGDKPDADAPMYKKLWWIGKTLPRLYSDKDMRPHYENVLNSMGFGHEDIFQSLLRTASESDDVMKTVENLALKSVNIDGDKFKVAEHYAKMVRGSFKDSKVFTRKNAELMKDVIINNDLQSLSNTSNVEYIKELLEDSSKLEAAIAKEKELIKEYGRDGAYSFYVKQAQGLAKFMRDNSGVSAAQLLNPTNIARELGTENKVNKVDIKLVNAIDRLSSLEAIKLTDDGSKAKLVELINTEKEGIEVIMASHHGYVQDSKRKLFRKNDANFIKGYTREIFNQDVEVKIGKVSDRKKLEKEGFTFVSTLEKSEFDVGSVPLALYTSEVNALQQYNKQAFRITDTKRKGTSIGDILMDTTELDPTTMKRLEAKIVKDIESKVAKETSKLYAGKDMATGNMLPVFDSLGNVKSYRYMMSRSTKEELMREDTRVHTVIGHMFASSLDKVSSKDMNDMTVDVLIKDMEENYVPGQKVGKNFKEYVVIGPEGIADKGFEERWSLLPKNTQAKLKKLAKKMSKDGKFNGIAVRADLVRMYFGERDFSIADTKWAKKSPVVIRKLLRLAEMWWKQIGKIAKVAIVIKTPAVWIGNLFSNYMTLLQMGIGPIESLKLMTKGFNELQEYKKLEKDLMDLDSLRIINKAKGENTYHLERKIESIKGQMARTSVHKMIERGFFSNIVEDVHQEDRVANTKIGRLIEEKTENMPSLVKQGLHWVYLTENTPVYKYMLQATQYGDFVARYALFHGTKQKRTAGKHVLAESEMEKLDNELMDMVLDTFINYNILDNKYIKYINDMTIVMFTKFFLGLIKVLKKGLLDRPLNFLIAAIAQMSFIDVEDITDHSLFTKNYSAMIKNPLDTIIEVLFPSLLETPTWAGDAVKAVYR